MYRWCRIALRLLALAVLWRACPDTARAGALPDWATPDWVTPDWATPESGRLLATTGVSQIEGAGGGGLGAWAVITGYGTQDAIGANLHSTYVGLPDYTLGGFGVAAGFYDRLELSYARNVFDTGAVGARLGLGRGFTLDQDVAGAKLRLFGDAVYDQDRWLPQVSVGAMFKATNHEAVLRAVGARSASGTDVYVAATKLLLRHSLLVNITLRETNANQFGLLGFGGDRERGTSLQTEASVARLLSRHVVIGAEWRTRPDNLRFARERDAYDAFIAWFPAKAVSVTLALLSLGPIARQSNQTGAYLSVQLGF